MDLDPQQLLPADLGQAAEAGGGPPEFEGGATIDAQLSNGSAGEKTSKEAAAGRAQAAGPPTNASPISNGVATTLAGGFSLSYLFLSHTL
jgi:hypothetical protein